MYFFFWLLTNYEFIECEPKYSFAEIIELLPNYKTQIKEDLKKSDYKSLVFDYFKKHEIEGIYLLNKNNEQGEINSKLKHVKKFISKAKESPTFESKIYKELEKLLEADISVVADIEDETIKLLTDENISKIAKEVAKICEQEREDCNNHSSMQV